MREVRETAVRMVQARKVLTRKDAVRTLAAARIAGPMGVARKAPDRKIEVRISNDASPIWKDEWANLLAA